MKVHDLFIIKAKASQKRLNEPDLVEEFIFNFSANSKDHAENHARKVLQDGGWNILYMDTTESKMFDLKEE